jgi:hypothetical protein
MLQQQLRAEVEAEGWRRIRADLATPAPAPAVAAPAPAAPVPQPIEDERRYHRGGSAVLKALVRFALGAFGAYLAWIAGMDSGAGEFEVWLWVGSGFVVSLALTAFGPGRAFVHFLAETARWVLILAAGVGVVWLLVHASANGSLS